MSRSIYVTSTGASPAITEVFAGAIAALGADAVAVFQPVVGVDGPLRLTQPIGTGVDAAAALADPDAALSTIVAAYTDFSARHGAVVVLGAQGLLGPTEFSYNARLAANLNAPIALLVTDPTLRASAIAEVRRQRAQLAACFDTDQGKSRGSIAATLGALRPGATVSAPGEPDAQALAIILGCQAGLYPRPARVLFSGPLGAEVAQLWASQLPGVERDTASSDLASQVAQQLKDTRPGTVTTPLRFEAELLRRAKQAARHIVLPEGTEPRIITAAGILLGREICRLTLLGDPAQIKARASELGVDISSATLVDPATDPVRERFAREYAELRKKKGVTYDQAFEKMADVSYFGTMMVHLGMADGMVSGAVNTTAHTIRPALEFVKTRPGVAVVSSVFFMCLADRVLVYGDCAVNPNPSADQLADIAVSSAATARAFGLDPRVAMLSYSTGTSATGADVDLVVEATALVRQREPALSVDGPLQYDAAMSATVAKTKLPDSPVAGRANVLIFPDLSAGNITYKAVQRSADAIAVGPVLQGLNKPVNDLSRGALVSDIVNTVAVTAIQGAI